MNIDTHQDLEAAIARLAARTPQSLATFIASLAMDTGPIGEHVRTFIVGDNLSETTASLQKRIDTLRASARSHTQHPAKEGVAERLAYILRSIETLVLPANPATAFALLVQLIERDGDAMEQRGDDDWSVQMNLATAANLIATAIKVLPSPEAKQTLQRLIAEDAYGTRAPLAHVLANLSD